MLDQKLMERQARESGICPVREELFGQSFDEIIRQITLHEPERGILLLRVRDEIKMTIAAYQTLYQNSTSFAMRKQLQAEHGQADLKKTIDQLVEKRANLQKKLLELKSKCEAISKRQKERKEIDAKSREFEVEILRYQEKKLDHFRNQQEG